MLFCSKVRDIDPSEKQSWDKKVFLTCDIDWAPDEVIDFTVEFFRANSHPDTKITFLATHTTPVLEIIALDKNFDVGIHPNFNKLIENCESRDRTPESIILELREQFPKSKVIRSHSCVTSFRLLSIFSEFGFSHEMNTFIPGCADITLKPWRNWDGMVQVPYIWQDDMHLMYGNKVAPLDLLGGAGVKVINFHPIHLFLNTFSMKHYEAAKPYYQKYRHLKDYVNPNSGIRTVIQDLLNVTPA